MEGKDPCKCNVWPPGAVAGAEFGDVGFTRFAFAARHLHLTRPCHVHLRQSVIA
jgi:hypothetical protein